MVPPHELRRGLVIVLDGAPHSIEEVQTVGTAKTKHKIHVRLRNLRNGRVGERTLQETDHLSVVDVDYHLVQFSYAQGDEYVFNDSKSFDEVRLSAEQVGDRRWFLKDNTEYKAVFLDGQLLDIELPDHAECRVVETAPPQHGGQQSTYKSAKLESGLEIMVPLFIATGESVRVDTRTQKYAGKGSG
jgi:elongation factor P